ncbi:MAG: PEP-CTERM sorting domain-containing protein [Planctomycetota bacterium]|nr:MAG: PEP-CTERM sorting domain-containing protein [Planctomycetota bacterium]
MRFGLALRAAGALVFVLAALVPATAAEVSLRTMSFNARYAGTAEGLFGENGWYNFGDPSDARNLKAIQVAKDYAPDILGTQELLYFQLDDFSGATLAGGLTDYDYYGVGRENGVALGEFAAIFYLRDRFNLVDSGTFWLSQTPEVAGSKYPGAGSIRIASWVVLDDASSGQELFVLNTHLDNSSSAARSYAAGLIRDFLPSLAGNLPTLVMGDMNATETTSVLTTLRGVGDPDFPELQDAYRVVHPVKLSNEATYHNFSGGTGGSRIDFILNTDDFTPQDATIVRTTYNGRYPSDHYPVTADFTLAVVPEPGTRVLFLLGIAALFATRFRH